MKKPNLTEIFIFFGTAAIVAAILLSFHNSKSSTILSAPVEQAQSPPSTTKPPVDDLASYKVPADQPRLLYIDKFNVIARVQSLGVTKTNAIAAPSNVFDAGWFKESSKPGQEGAMLIDGHISSDSTKGVFYNLKDLQKGDKISIEAGDKRQFNYMVTAIKTYDYDNVNMLEVLAPIDGSRPGLNLISCDGGVIKGTHSFDKRIVVFTKQI